MAKSRKPLMSICLVARNDDFHGDYRYRLSMCLNMLAKGLADIGREKEVEVIVCDWGSEVPLHKDLVLHPAAEKLKFMIIPRDLALSRQIRGATFAYPVGLNAAVRRSSGEYVCELTADVVLNAANLDTLLSVFAGKYPGIPTREALFPILRRQLHMVQAKRQPSLRELEEYLNRNLVLLPADTMGCGYGWASGIVMHRDLWHAMRGIDETMLYWGWMDIDFALRMTQRYPIMDLANFGVCGVHLQHYFQTPNDPVFRARLNNPANDTPSFTVNDENWGLGEQEFPIHCVEKVWDEEPADVTSLVGTTEKWDVTPAQVVEELTKPELHKQVQGIVQGVRIDPPQLMASAKEFNAFAALSWHAQRRAARTYVETGMIGSYGACVVTRVSPGVEVYAVGNWSRPQPDGGSLMLLCNNLLKGLGQHWGYIRFVGDDPATAVDRISKSTGGRFAVDLALVRAGAGLPATQQALELAASLTPGGAIVVSADEEPSFNSVWSALASKRPALTYLRFADKITGIALAATLA